MGAREKLNASYFNGSLIVAALFGLVANSWPLFILSLTVLLAGNLYFREIRPKRHGSDRQSTFWKGK